MQEFLQNHLSGILGLLSAILNGVFGIIAFLLNKNHGKIIQDLQDRKRDFSVLLKEFVDFKSEVYKDYIPRNELSQQMNEIKDILARINDHLLNRKK